MSNGCLYATSSSFHIFVKSMACKTNLNKYIKVKFVTIIAKKIIFLRQSKFFVSWSICYEWNVIKNLEGFAKTQICFCKKIYLLLRSSKLMHFMISDFNVFANMIISEFNIEKTKSDSKSEFSNITDIYGRFQRCHSSFYFLVLHSSFIFLFNLWDLRSSWCFYTYFRPWKSIWKSTWSIFFLAQRDIFYYKSYDGPRKFL